MVQPVDHVGQLSPRPVFLIQGLADQVVPPGSAQRLYDAAGAPRKLWLQPDIGHLGMYGVLPEEYERRVVGFFESVFQK